MDTRPDAFHFDSTTYTYFRLKPDASLATLRTSLPDFVVRRLHIPKHNAFGVVITLSVLPVRDIHFAPAGVNAMKSPGDKATVVSAAAIAFLVLLAACVNFINLTTARVSRRALEVAGAGVTVNTIQPGLHDTDRLAHLGVEPSRLARSVPARFIGDADDFGAVAAFLCSEQARYITGVAVPVDGGVFAGLQ